MAGLMFRSPVYMQRGNGSILFHRSPHYLQSGHGFGSFFGKILKWLAPAAKKTIKAVTSVGKQILANPTIQDIGAEIRDQAIKTGVHAAANLIQGEEVTPTLQTDIAEARKEIANKVRKVGSGKKRPAILLDVDRCGLTKNTKKRRKTSPPDIFDFEEE